MAAEKLFERVALIGLGHIGSSLARALRKEGLCAHVAGCASTAKTRERALELGIVDTVFEDPAACVAGAELVVLCSPVGTYGEIGAAIAPALEPGAILSDVGSVKHAVIEALAPLVPDGVHFVPAHPVAGQEHSGPDSGFAELFEGHWCILTPPPGADAGAVERIAELWRRAGMRIELMEPRHHDLVLAITSHLPHLIAYNIVATAQHLEDVTESEVFKYAAGGFRDATRIAASDPVMWRDVFLNNREAVLEMLGRFNEDLSALQRAIRWGEADKLEEMFARTREIRRGVIDAKQA